MENEVHYGTIYLTNDTVEGDGLDGLVQYITKTLTGLRVLSSTKWRVFYQFIKRSNVYFISLAKIPTVNSRR